MKTFWSAFVLPLAFISLVNYRVDVPRRFWRLPPLPPAQWEPRKALILPDYFDDRTARRSILSGRPRPNLLILGSSRAMLTRPSMAAGDASGFNAAISGAGLEDYAAVWQLLKRQGKTPARLIWFLDDW